MWKGHEGLTLYILVLYILLYTMNPVDTDERSLSRRKRYVVFPEGSSFSIALCMTVHTLTPDNIFTEGLNWGISYDLPNESKPSLDPFLQVRRKDHQPGDSIKQRYPELLKTDQWIQNGNSLGYENSNKEAYSYNALDNFKKSNKKNQDPPAKPKCTIGNRITTTLNDDIGGNFITSSRMGFNGRICILRALCEASQRLMPKGNTLVEKMMRIAFSLPLKRVLMPYEPKEHHIYTEAHRAGHKGARCESMFSGCSFSLIDMALGKYSIKSDDYGNNIQSNNLNVHEAVDDSVGNSLMRYNMK